MEILSPTIMGIGSTVLYRNVKSRTVSSLIEKLELLNEPSRAELLSCLSSAWKFDEFVKVGSGFSTVRASGRDSMIWTINLVGHKTKSFVLISGWSDIANRRLTMPDHLNFFVWPISSLSAARKTVWNIKLDSRWIQNISKCTCNMISELQISLFLRIDSKLACLCLVRLHS